MIDCESRLFQMPFPQHRHDEFLKKKIETQLKKKKNLLFFRRRCKRRQSLVSQLTMSSTSSITIDENHNGNGDNVASRSTSLKSDIDPVVIMADLAIDSPLESCPINSSSASDDEISVDGSTSSTTLGTEFINDFVDESTAKDHVPDHRPLHSFTNTTVNQFSIDLLDFFRVSRLPKNQRCHLLNLFRKYLPSPNLVPNSSDDLCSKYDDVARLVNLFSRGSFPFDETKVFSPALLSIGALGLERMHWNEKICGMCYSPLEKGVCSNEHCIHQGTRVPSEDTVEIVSFNVVEQLRLTINHHLKLLRQYQQQARDLTTADPNDIVRGDVYQSMLKHHQEFFLSVMLHTDGMPLYKSKNCSAWPILGAILELPPYARTRDDNMLLFGLWIGKKKPNFDILCQKLVEQLTSLKNTGIRSSDHEQVKVLFPMLMGDMPALSTMVQFVEPHAFFACMFCEIRGVFNHRGHCIIYPIDDDANLRSSETFRRCSELAHMMQGRIDRERTKGLKGSSAFIDILDVPLPHSVVIDAMHTVFLCHSKKLLIYYLSLISKENQSKVSEKLRSLNYIHDILRRPRSILNIHKWKASEVRVFMLYIGLPVLAEFLPEDQCGDLALYTTILRLLHDHWQNDKQKIDAVSFLLTVYIQKLSAKVDDQECPSNLLTITTHTQIHLPFQCRKFGRLDWLTNFVFESFLGFLKGFIKGSSGAGDQIAFAFESNFILSKMRDSSKIQFGHFSIDEKTFGSNIIKMNADEPLRQFLHERGHASDGTLHFTRLHHFNVTYHAFLYSRRGSTCSYLVSYERNNVIEYGYILCFVLSRGKCFAVLQQLTRVNHPLSSCFSSYSHLTAIKDFIDHLYIVVKRCSPSILDFHQTFISSIDCIRSRCFSVPFGSDLMVLTNYSSAFEHN